MLRGGRLVGQNAHGVVDPQLFGQLPQARGVRIKQLGDLDHGYWCGVAIFSIGTTSRIRAFTVAVLAVLARNARLLCSADAGGEGLAA